MIGPNNKGSAEMAIYLSTCDTAINLSTGTGTGPSTSTGAGPSTSTGIGPHTSVNTGTRSNGRSTNADIVTGCSNRIILNDTLESIPDQDEDSNIHVHTQDRLTDENGDTFVEVLKDQNTQTLTGSNGNPRVDSEERLLVSSSSSRTSREESKFGSSVDRECEATDDGEEKNIVNAHLTYVQLPWYIIIEGM